MTVKDRILKINPDDIGVPQGAYRVELCDRHTGKVKERVESKNYLTPMYLNALKWWNAAQFQVTNRWVHLGEANPNADHESIWPGEDMSIPPRMPMECMMSLSSSVAENTAYHWAPGRVLGYGTRWKAGSVPASGPRGQINEAQSELGQDSLKLVWDFNENQGNGAFNSLAIGNINNVSYGAGLVGSANSAWANAEKPYINVPFPLTASTSYFWPCYQDATKLYWIDIRSSSQMWVVSALKADFVDAGNYWDGSGVTLSDEVQLNGVTWSSSNSSSSTVAYAGGYYQVAKDGSGNWYMAYTPRYARLCVSKWNSAGTKQWTVNLTPTTTSFLSPYYGGITIIGSNVYATMGNGATDLTVGVDMSKRIWRFNTSDGALTGNFDISNGGDNYFYGGLTTDGTDLFVNTIGGLEQYDTTGPFIESYGSWVGGSFQETGASPWSVTANYQGSGAGLAHRFGVYFDVPTAPSDRVSGGSAAQYSPWAITYFDGKLWNMSVSAGMSGLPNAATGGFYPTGGGNCWSRSVLGSEITKSVSSTMKWTYELTFPSEWRSGISHLALPA